MRYMGVCSCGRPCKVCEAYDTCGGCKHPIICKEGLICCGAHQVLLTDGVLPKEPRGVSYLNEK